MTDPRKMTTSVQNLCFGFGAIVCALACGAGNEGSTPTNGGDQPGQDLPQPGPQLSPACDDNPLAKACSDVPSPPVQEPPKPLPEPADAARAKAEAVLASNCGQCHGYPFVGPIIRESWGIAAK